MEKIHDDMDFDRDEDYELSLEDMLLIDKIRRALAHPDYDPVSGQGCMQPRVEVATPLPSCGYAMVPP